MTEEQLEESIDNIDLESMDINDVLNDDVLNNDSFNEEDDSLVNLEDLATEGAQSTDDIDLAKGLEDIILDENTDKDDSLSSEAEQEDVVGISEEVEEPAEDILDTDLEAALETPEELETEESIEEPIAEPIAEPIVDEPSLEDALSEEVSAIEEAVCEEEECTDMAEEETELLEEDNSSCEEENLEVQEEHQEQIDEPIIEEQPEDTIEEEYEAPEDTQEEVVEEVSEEIPTDSEVITNNPNDIKIEFGIEAKGFILSTNMMEVMISKGYIFKEMIDNKVFDAVMIFNGNLDNTVVTNDIKIKIEDGKIQLIKG